MLQRSINRTDIETGGWTPYRYIDPAAYNASTVNYHHQFNTHECSTFLGQLSLASLWGRLIEYSFGWGKGGNVTSAGWQVTLCDPMWHVSSQLPVAVWQLCELLYTCY